MTPKIAIVILNWNGVNYLQKFLPSVVENSDYPGTKIWVIDNGSTDRSIKLLMESFPGVQLVCLDKNYGFTGGYNLGLKQIVADYYVILNSDIEVTPNWIEPIIGEFEKNPLLAAAAPKLLSYSEREKFEYAGASGGFIDHLGYPFCRGRIISNTETDNGQYNSPLSVFWASGACMFVRASVFHEMGGFDEAFFAHMEEIDLCWRMKNAGYMVFCFPQSTVYHVGGGTLPNNNPRKIYLNYRNNLLLLYKNLPKRRLYYVLFLRFFLDMSSAFIFLLQRKFSFSLSVLKAYKDFIAMRRKCKTDRTKVKWHPEIFKKSIVVGFFLLGRKTFSDYE